MKTSIINHIFLDLPSSAVVLGTTVGEIYAYFKNKPPVKLTLYQIDAIEKSRLKNGFDKFWFDSPLAEKEPLIVHTADQLANMLPLSCKKNEELINYFKDNLPKNLNLGGTIEAVRMINTKFPKETGEIFKLFSKLSHRGFFKLI